VRLKIKLKLHPMERVVRPDDPEASPPHPDDQNCVASNLRIGPVIGSGAFGSVHLGLLLTQLVAVKVMRKLDLLQARQESQLVAESSTLASLSHPFIARHVASVQDSRHVYLVIELLPLGDLFSHIHAGRGALSRRAATFYAAQIVCALSYLHSSSLIYRDLKPENIVFSMSGYLKLVDFGFAKKLKSTERAYTVRKPDRCSLYRRASTSPRYSLESSSLALMCGPARSRPCIHTGPSADLVLACRSAERPSTFRQKFLHAGDTESLSIGGGLASFSMRCSRDTPRSQLTMLSACTRESYEVT
jgi:serine/threonine protein kinase